MTSFNPMEYISKVEGNERRSTSEFHSGFVRNPLRGFPNAASGLNSPRSFATKYGFALIVVMKIKNAITLFSKKKN